MNTATTTANSGTVITANRYETIMLIDDNSMDNFINKSLMESCDFAGEIIVCETARQGLDLLSKNQLPQIIFLDINMPHMDGFEFLDEFEKLSPEVHNRCKIIMLSTSESFKDLNRANKNVFVKKFLNKPLTEDVLKAINV